MGKRLIIILLVAFVLVAGLIFARNGLLPKNNPTMSKSTSKNVNNENAGGNISRAPISFIEGLRNRQYEGGEIKIEEMLSANTLYTRYLISYYSDGLKIYGIMNRPIGKGPFPVVILNHGYFNASTFTSGNGTDNMANILANEGYLTLASDYRGFGNSEDVKNQPSRGHRPEYAIDVLNLIASVKSLAEANLDKIVMWGHSMGGEVALRVSEATDQLKAVVLWAPTSANAADNAIFYGRRHLSPTGVEDNTNFDGASPINYLKYIKAPISLHQGLSDTEVDPQWSKNLYDALRKSEKKIEYYEYRGQDHNFVNFGWEEISKNTLEFYRRYLK